MNNNESNKQKIWELKCIQMILKPESLQLKCVRGFVDVWWSSSWKSLAVFDRGFLVFC